MADQEGLACGVDDLGCDFGELVQRSDSFDLRQEPIDEAEVATGDTNDRSDGSRVGDAAIGRVRREW